MRRSSRSAFTLIELLVVIAIIAVLIGLLLPAVQQVRAAAARTACLNNLHNQGLAVQGFHDDKGAFPTANTPTFGSLFTQILPYLDQAQLESRYNYNLTPTAPANLPLTVKKLKIYICPTMQAPAIEQTTAYSSYAACIGTQYSWGLATNDDGVIVRYQTNSRGITLAEIAAQDGASTTFMIGEMGFQLKDYYFTSGPNAGQVRGGNTSWPYGYASYSFGSTLVPMNTKVHNNPSGLIGSGLHGFRSDHRGGCHFLFADGSASFLRDSISLDTYRALSTRNGNEAMSDY